MLGNVVGLTSRLTVMRRITDRWWDAGVRGNTGEVKVPTGPHINDDTKLGERVLVGKQQRKRLQQGVSTNIFLRRQKIKNLLLLHTSLFNPAIMPRMVPRRKRRSEDDLVVWIARPLNNQSFDMSLLTEDKLMLTLVLTGPRQFGGCFEDTEVWKKSWIFLGNSVFCFYVMTQSTWLSLVNAV